MIETGGAIELLDNRRELDAHAPFVAAATGALERGAPLLPPRRDAAGDRFDDEQAVALRGAVEQAGQQRCSCRV